MWDRLKGSAMQLMMIETKDLAEGLAALDGLDDAVDDGRITVEDLALVYRTEKGKVKIKQTRDMTARRGAMRGLLVGALVGLFPVSFLGAAAVGAGSGALLAGGGDKGVDNAMMKEIGKRLEGSVAIVFVLADDSSVEAIAAAIEDQGNPVAFQVVPPETQKVITEAAKAADALVEA
jgi:uncharacterized membrane protein